VALWSLHAAIKSQAAAIADKTLLQSFWQLNVFVRCVGMKARMEVEEDEDKGETQKEMKKRRSMRRERRERMKEEEKKEEEEEEEEDRRHTRAADHAARSDISKNNR
jgi:hypothetical protein